MTNFDPAASEKLSRRSLLHRTAGTAALLGLPGLASAVYAGEEKSSGNAGSGQIKQSIVHWCFAKYWDVEETAKVAKKLGCRSIELISPDHWPTLKKYDLTCAIASIDMAPDAPFVKGFNNPKYWPKVLKATKDAIDAAAANRRSQRDRLHRHGRGLDATRKGPPTASKVLSRSSATPRRTRSTSAWRCSTPATVASHERASRLPGRPHRLLHRHHQAGRLAAA